MQTDKGDAGFKEFFNTVFGVEAEVDEVLDNIVTVATRNPSYRISRYWSVRQAGSITRPSQDLVLSGDGKQYLIERDDPFYRFLADTHAELKAATTVTEPEWITEIRSKLLCSGPGSEVTLTREQALELIGYKPPTHSPIRMFPIAGRKMPWCFHGFSSRDTSDR